MLEALTEKMNHGIGHVVCGPVAEIFNNEHKQMYKNWHENLNQEKYT